MIISIDLRLANMDFRKHSSRLGNLKKAAKELRNQWNLGYDPIPDVVEMLEDKGRGF